MGVHFPGPLQLHNHSWHLPQSAHSASLLPGAAALKTHIAITGKHLSMSSCRLVSKLSYLRLHLLQLHTQHTISQDEGSFGLYDLSLRQRQLLLQRPDLQLQFDIRLADTCCRPNQH